MPKQLGNEIHGLAHETKVMLNSYNSVKLTMLKCGAINTILS